MRVPCLPLDPLEHAKRNYIWLINHYGFFPFFLAIVLDLILILFSFIGVDHNFVLGLRLYCMKQDFSTVIFHIIFVLGITGYGFFTSQINSDFS